MNSSSATTRIPWLFVLTAALILLITMGARQTIGLFVAPLNAATGLGIVSISLAVAIGQFIWGFAQPVFGAVADRYGAGSLAILIGAIMQRMAGERRSLAAGIINAGGSLGQFVFAPAVQAAIFGIGWVGAMIGVAGATLLTLPLAFLMRRRSTGMGSRAAAAVAPSITLRQQLR